MAPCGAPPGKFWRSLMTIQDNISRPLSRRQDRRNPRRRHRPLSDAELAGALLLMAPPADRDDETLELLGEAVDYSNAQDRTRRTFRQLAGKIRSMGVSS